MFRCLPLALLLATLVTPAVAAAAPLVFTAIPDEDETRLQQRFQSVADYLAETLDVEVRFIPVTSYAASVTEPGVWRKCFPGCT